MAQINAQYPDLNQIFGAYSVNPVEYGMQRFESAQNADRLNQQQALQDMLFQQQNDPLKLEATRLGNQTTAAGLPGIFATSSLQEDKARVSRESIGEQVSGAKSKINADISDNDLKVLENSAQRMAMSRDPNERAAGVELLQLHRSVIQDKEMKRFGTDQRLREIREGGAQARQTQQQAIDAGKYVKGSGGGAGKSIEDQIASGKLNFEKAATLLSGAAFMAEMEGDMETAGKYRQMADQYLQQHIASRQAAGQVSQQGKPDIGAMTGLPVNPPQPARQFQPVSPQPQAVPQQMDPAVFQKAFGGFEPNKYDYRIGPNGVPQRKLKGN